VSEQRGAPEKPDTKRRWFVNGLLGSSLTALAASVVYPIVRFVNPPQMPEAVKDQVLAGKLSEMTGESWKIFPFGQAPGILVRTGPEEFRAFSATCTHLDCTVQFEDKSKRIWCPCHNGWYDLEGRNVAGPPPHPLDSYVVQIVGDDIFVSKG
jgi:Rieske Fe-S protein